MYKFHLTRLPTMRPVWKMLIDLYLQLAKVYLSDKNFKWKEKKTKEKIGTIQKVVYLRRKVVMIPSHLQPISSISKKNLRIIYK